MEATRGITKGAALKDLLSPAAVALIAESLGNVHPQFDRAAFEAQAGEGLSAMEMKARAAHIAKAMRTVLPPTFAEAKSVLIASFGPKSGDPALTTTGGLNTFFYFPHSSYLEGAAADALTTFDDVFQANVELTQRFTAEFSIRPVIARWPQESLKALSELVASPNADCRRLVSEGTRPRLPWGSHIAAFRKDPTPCLPLLDALKWDDSLYVRRSVANHVGDILKDNVDIGLAICDRWVRHAKSEDNAVAELARRRDFLPARVEAAAALIPTAATQAGKKTAKTPARRATARNKAEESTQSVVPFAPEAIRAVQEELLWVVRHALRNPDKKGNKKATALRKSAHVGL
jgi:3-methyladenine DNA glycosylase AlkC